MLTYEQQRKAVTLAMQVDTGLADFENILTKFEQYPNLANNIVEFWFSFNNMTRRALKNLVYHKCRLHLEKCLEVQIGTGR